MIASLPEPSASLIPGKSPATGIAKSTGSAKPFSSALEEAAQNLQPPAGPANTAVPAAAHGNRSVSRNPKPDPKPASASASNPQTPANPPAQATTPTLIATTPVEFAALPLVVPSTGELKPEATVAEPATITGSDQSLPVVAPAVLASEQATAKAEPSETRGVLLAQPAQVPVSTNDTLLPAAGASKPATQLEKTAISAVKQATTNANEQVSVQPPPKPVAAPIASLQTVAASPAHLDRTASSELPAVLPRAESSAAIKDTNMKPVPDNAATETPNRIATATTAVSQPPVPDHSATIAPAELTPTPAQASTKNGASQRAISADPTHSSVAAPANPLVHAVQSAAETSGKEANTSGSGTAKPVPASASTKAPTSHPNSSTVADSPLSSSAKPSETPNFLTNLQSQIKPDAGGSSIKDAAHTADNPAASTANPADADAHTDAASALSNPLLHSARLVERIGQTELHLGLQDGDLGKVNIRTSMGHNQITAEISVEHGDLGRVLAAELPGLQTRLSEQRLPVANIILQNQSGNGSAGFDQGSRQGHRAPEIAIPQFSETEVAATTVSGAEVASTSKHLDLHM